MHISIIGCGEVGCCYADAFINAGYSMQLYTPRPSQTVLNLVTAHQIPLYKHLSNWLKQTDVIIATTPGSVSLSVAKEVMPFLNKETIYADFTSCSPDDKRKAASLAKENGVLYADVVIMGSIDLNKAKTPLICSGNGAEQLGNLMSKLGTPIKLLPASEAGDAAYLKLLRSVFMKGLSALTVECMMAAHYFGVKDLLYEILSDFDQTPLNEYLDMLLRNHVIHACRQTHEVIQAREQLISSGLPQQLLPAIENLFTTTCQLSKSDYIGNKNPTAEEALKWLIKTRCRSGKKE